MLFSFKRLKTDPHLHLTNSTQRNHMFISLSKRKEDKNAQVPS